MSVPNFSSLAGLEVAGKFVVVGNTWLLMSNSNVSCFELSCVALGFDNSFSFSPYVEIVSLL